MSDYVNARSPTFLGRVDAFKGRHESKQYLPMKPVKFGFKFFVITESTTGYVKNYMLYLGKKY